MVVDYPVYSYFSCDGRKIVVMNAKYRTITYPTNKINPEDIEYLSREKDIIDVMALTIQANKGLWHIESEILMLLMSK